MKRRVLIGGLPSGLEMYLVDDAVSWQADPTGKFEEAPGGAYRLEVYGQEGKQFKIFVLVDGSDQYKMVREALREKLGMIVTGWGDVLPDGSGLIRIWFLFSDMGKEGRSPMINNVWGNVDVIGVTPEGINL